MPRPWSVTALAALIALGTAAGGARAQGREAVRVPVPLPLPDERQYVGQPVPDIVVQTSGGAVPLSTLWQRGPVVLTLVFTRCAGVCSPFLRTLRSADERLGSPADVQRVVLSFDARDTVADMHQTARHLGVGDRPGWIFGTAAPEDIEQLTSAFGFWYAWDASRQQFDHPAMVVGIRQGTIARLLVGGAVNAVRLGEVVREARGQFVASYPLPGAVRFRCFDYDPATGNATFAPGSFLLFAPAVGAVVATSALFTRRRGRARPSSSPRS
jgi:cytochrome oxidase Cu insertion factor (SCO1/SenC/PrrC family)